MFSRKKPPQLSVLEELQQTYNDVCNSSVKNLHMEETGNFAEALKGWKSLHTSLLYKIDLFEKSSKINMEEQTILTELRAIRDENVKHLVRIQLRLDEENRRRKRSAEQAPQTQASSAHKMTIPSLRSSNPASRSFNSNNQRSMMKSLRPQPATYKLSQKSRDTVQAAVNKSWNKPTAKPTPAKSEEVLFDDFDQNEYVGNGNGNWERLNSHDSNSTSNGSFNSNTSNLIDLDDENGDELNFFDENVTKSMGDLSIKKSPPPPPPPRARQYSANTSKAPPVPTESPPRPKPPHLTNPSSRITPSPHSTFQGYDDDDTFANGELDPEQAAADGMNPSEQEALIKSIRGIDELAATQILNDIVVRGDEVYWDDIVGLESAKNSLKEAVVYPFLRPDLFRGLREPTRGMLLFGPPGTGKTMLARAVATESKSTFFSISSSSLTSKYLGESEKLVKALFLLAKKLSPSIVFIDEIDSLLGTRTEGEVESMRRIKNEFLVQWSELSSAAAGRDSSAGDVSRVLILGATNLPWGIDDAARRRFAKRVYIPLPEDETRKLQISKLLQYQKHTLSDEDFEKLVELTKSFSGSDITLLAKDSAMGPLRSLGDKLLSTPTEEIRPIQLSDFVESLKYIRPSVSSEGLGEYEKWAAQFGSSGA
ncbi:hypothetical protein CXQ85_000529 [Candidozyma haemuli]|uniref:AAA+ ATPase domain-containing protein n=1 Tax=Candidozyma haemuli TaxID=45357 RepID=A0A2V1AUN4_9ASCO|nr:hypothetical protein CXQ85_000529 [[Candida] haemuloni]PVH21548.1 hypothetical protein CXQ85_000529 [[Candida] haemuloni]